MYTHKVNIPYYNVYTSFRDTLYLYKNTIFVTSLLKIHQATSIVWTSWLCHSSGGWLVTIFPLQRPGFAPRAIHVGFVDKLALGQVFLRVLWFPLSISFNRCSIFTYVTSGDWTMGPLTATVPQRQTPPLCNNKNKQYLHIVYLLNYTNLCPPGSKLDAMLPAILAPASATLLADSLSFSRPSLSNWLPLPSDKETSPMDGFPPRWLTASIDTASN
jgi:hypothetical protein